MFPTPPTLKEGTDNWRLFHALSDGEVHDHHELYGLRMIVHSRKSDLVHKHGCNIRCWSKAGTSYYQLLPSLSEPEAVAPGTGGRPGHEGSVLVASGSESDWGVRESHSRTGGGPGDEAHGPPESEGSMFPVPPGDDRRAGDDARDSALPWVSPRQPTLWETAS